MPSKILGKSCLTAQYDISLGTVISQETLRLRNTVMHLTT